MITNKTKHSLLFLSLLAGKLPVQFQETLDLYEIS